MTQISQFAEAESYESIQTRLKAEKYITSNLRSEEKSSATMQLIMQPMDLSVIEANKSATSYEIGRAYEMVGARLFLMGDFDAAQELLTKSLELLMPSGEEYLVYRWMGIMQGVTLQTEKGIESYLLGIESVKKKHGESLEGKKLMLALHTNVIGIYIRKGDYRAAKEHCFLASQYSKEANDLYYTVIADLNLASIQIANADGYSAINTLKKHEDIIERFSNIKLNFYNLLGAAFRQIEDLPNATLYIQKSIDATPDHPTNATGLLVNRSSLAHVDYFNGKFRNALNEYTDILKSYQVYPDRFGQLIAETYNRRSKTYIGLGKLDSAYLDVKHALAQPEDYETWKIQYFATLSRVYAAYYAETGQEIYLDSVQWNMDRTEKYIDSLRIEHRHLEGEDGLNAFLFDSYALNLESLFEIYQHDPTKVNMEELFKFFEQIKSYSITEYLKTDDAVKEGMLPIGIVEEERQLKSEISELKKQMYLSLRDTLKNQEQDYAKQINKLGNEYTDFLKKLEGKYPNYYKFQYEEYETNLSMLQNSLASDEAVIQYFMSLNTIYILSVQKTKCHFYKVNISQDWKSELMEFVSLLYEPESVSQSGEQALFQQTFVKNARYYYKTLLEGPLADLSAEVSNLKLIADNQLNYLPFGILLASEPEVEMSIRDFDYVISRYNISYDDSAAEYLQSINTRSVNMKYDYIGFLPSYLNETENLTYSNRSVQTAIDLFDGHCYTTDTDEISNQSKAFTQSEIVHLAMHGVVDQLNPSLSHLRFSSDEKDNLYLSDIYSKSVQSSLVVLSACNTGAGKYTNGEGIQNISRAFRFAGAPSTVMSLWTLPDVQTAQIEEQFFQNLKMGMRKDLALSQAKRSYLEEAPNAYLHPFYWAGFVPTGNMESIDTAEIFPMKYLLGVIFVVIIALLIKIYKK